MCPKGQDSADLILMSTILSTSNIVIEIYQITDSSLWALLLLLGSAIPTGGIFLPRILADLPIQSFLLSYGRCSKIRSVSITKMHNPRNATILRTTLLIRDSSDSNFVFCLKLSVNPGRSMVLSGRWKVTRLRMVIYSFLNVPILVWQARTESRIIKHKCTYLLFLWASVVASIPGEINSWSH